MAYGLQVIGPNGKTLINPGVSGGSIYYNIIEDISPSWYNPVAYDYTDIPGQEYLKVVQAIAGTCGYTLSTVSGHARLTISPSSQYNAIPGTYLLFSSFITEPDYGLKVINEAGEKLVSNVYRTPAFLGKISQQYSGAYSLYGADGYVVDELFTPISLGSGRRRLLMYKMADSTDVYFCGLPYFGPAYVNLINYMIRPSGSSPTTPPDVYVFDLDGVDAAPGTGNYGLKVFNSSGQTTYNSNKSHLSLSTIQQINTGTIASPSLYTITQNSGITPLIFCPTNGGQVLADYPSYYVYEDPMGSGYPFNNPYYKVNQKFTGYRKNGTQFAVVDFIQWTGGYQDGFTILFNPPVGQPQNLFTYHADSYGYA